MWECTFTGLEGHGGHPLTTAANNSNIFIFYLLSNNIKGSKSGSPKININKTFEIIKQSLVWSLWTGK